MTAGAIYRLRHTVAPQRGPRRIQWIRGGEHQWRWRRWKRRQLSDRRRARRMLLLLLLVGPAQRYPGV